MWKRREDELPAPPAGSPSFARKEVPAVETPKTLDEIGAGVAHIGKSVLIKGELSGSEDLYLDGEVQGTIELRGHSLTIGPHGRVRAHTQARDVVVHGRVDGNIGAERVELKKSAIIVGDIVTKRVAIEDGAFFKGSIDVQREAKSSEPVKVEAKPATAAASVAAGPGPVVEPKR